MNIVIFQYQKATPICKIGAQFTNCTCTVQTNLRYKSLMKHMKEKTM